jgi:hypothetical protein
MIPSPEPLSIEALLELYELCLAQGNLTPLQHEIERQFLRSPTPFDPLMALGNELSSRALAMRQSDFEQRHSVQTAFYQVYRADAEILLAHLPLTAHRVETWLQTQGFQATPEEVQSLFEMLESTQQTSQQLEHHIQRTEQIIDLLDDWLRAHLWLQVHPYSSSHFLHL